MSQPGYIANPITVDDFIHNVRFQLDNVQGYWEMAKDDPNGGCGAATAKAGCLLDCAQALKTKLDSVRQEERSQSAIRNPQSEIVK